MNLRTIFYPAYVRTHLVVLLLTKLAKFFTYHNHNTKLRERPCNVHVHSFWSFFFVVCKFYANRFRI